MELEEQVVPLALARRLKDLEVVRKILFYWAKCILDDECALVTSEGLNIVDDTVESVYVDSGYEGDYWLVRESYAAFTVAELGELLPRCYISWATPQNGEVKWWCHRMEAHFV